VTEQMTIDGDTESVEVNENPNRLDVPDTVEGHVVSWGAGVQSTCLALLCIDEHPALMRALDRRGANLPEAFVFADTGDEKRETYLHVWKMAKMMGESGYPLRVVRHPDAPLSEHVKEKAKAHDGGMATPPFYVESATGDPVPVLSRSCTHQFKAQPLDRWAKKYFDPPRGKALNGPVCAQWRGISTDEVTRMKPHPKRWATTWFPLIEMGWGRDQCREYVEGREYPDGGQVQAVRSACVFCPYHDGKEWKEVKNSDHDDWERALELDDVLRNAWDGEGSIAGLETEPFLVAQRVRLRDAIIEEEYEMFDRFEGECEGICGV